MLQNHGTHVRSSDAPSGANKHIVNKKEHGTNEHDGLGHKGS